jgi:hypothetical protein
MRIFIQTSWGKLAFTGRLQRSTVDFLRHRVESFAGVSLDFGRPTCLGRSEEVEAGVELRDVFEEQGLAIASTMVSFERIRDAKGPVMIGASYWVFCLLTGPSSCGQAVLALRLATLLGFGSLEAAMLSIVMFSKERCIMAKIF